MKHLLCEHQNTIAELKAVGLVSTQVAQEEQNQLETELHKDMRAVMVDIQKLDNENLVKELELVCSTHYYISPLKTLDWMCLCTLIYFNNQASMLQTPLCFLSQQKHTEEMTKTSDICEKQIAGE